MGDVVVLDERRAELRPESVGALAAAFEVAFGALDGDGSTEYLPDVTRHDAALWVVTALDKAGLLRHPGEASQTAPGTDGAGACVTAGERQGDTPGSPATSSRRRGGQGRHWNIDEVAAVIRDGARRHLSASRSLVEHYDIEKPMAGYLVKRAKTILGADALLPTGREKRARVAAPDAPSGSSFARAPHVLMCDDCTAEFTPAQAPVLHRHCLEVHGRRASRTERTPVASIGGVR